MFNIAAFNPIPEGPMGNCGVGILEGPAHSESPVTSRRLFQTAAIYNPSIERAVGRRIPHEKKPEIEED